MSSEWGKIESVGEDTKLAIEVITSSRGLYLFITGVDERIKVDFAKDEGVKFDLTDKTAQEIIDSLQTALSFSG